MAATRPRAQITAEALYAIFESHGPKKADWLKFGGRSGDASQQRVELVSNAQFWEALLREVGVITFKKSVVKDALHRLRTKHAGDWKISDKKASLWEETMVKRFQCQSQFLVASIRKGVKWATTIGKGAGCGNREDMSEGEDDGSGEHLSDRSTGEDFEEGAEEEEEEEEERHEDLPEADGADGAASAWVTRWHVEEHNAFGFWKGCEDEPEFAIKVLPPPGAQDPAQCMLARWADGSETEIEGYTFGDHQAHVESADAVGTPGKKQPTPTLFSSTLNGVNIQVKPGAVSCRHERLPCYRIFEGKGSICQLIIAEGIDSNVALSVIIEVAKMYVSGECSKAELKKVKDTKLKDACKPCKKTMPKPPQDADPEQEAPPTKKRRAQQTAQEQPSAASVSPAPAAAASSACQLPAPAAGAMMELNTFIAFMDEFM